MIQNSYEANNINFKLFGIIPIFSLNKVNSKTISDGKEYSINVTKTHYDEEFNLNDKRN